MSLVEELKQKVRDYCIRRDVEKCLNSSDLLGIRVFTTDDGLGAIEETFERGFIGTDQLLEKTQRIRDGLGDKYVKIDLIFTGKRINIISLKG